MRTILVTGSDTGIGKTHVVAALARLLAADGSSVQIVKVVETGVAAGEEGDAGRARRVSGSRATAVTLASFPAALAPAAAARDLGSRLVLEQLTDGVRALDPCDWRICEGAGGIASPLDDQNHDWVDFAQALEIDATVIVVPDRIGGINQARLAHAHAARAGLRAGVWLNAVAPVAGAVADSNRDGLRQAGVPVWAEQGCGSELPERPESVLAFLCAVETEASPFERGTRVTARDRQIHGREARATMLAGESTPWLDRCRDALEERDRKKLRRTLRVAARRGDMLNLADNDYLDLALDPAVVAAAAAAAEREGTSASASALITGWREPHASLVRALGAWHAFPYGLLWSSGYAANAAVLGELPRSGDLVFADRLIHNSMIAGLLRSGARLQRYAHLDLDDLERRLARSDADLGPGLRGIFVVTESVFSMDGDCPDLARLAALKRRYGFCWILDEAHALGWYGPDGAGLARAAGVEADVDVLVGTLGKTLATGGAYTLFRDEAVRDYLVNVAGEFIYSTALPPANAVTAEAALARVRELSVHQPQWHALSRAFRASLRAAGWAAPEGESPIVPVRLDDENRALALAENLRAAGIQAAAVRPPTVPVGTSRLRFSLKRTFTRADAERVLAALSHP